MKQLNFAAVGAGFMGKAHSLALAAYPMYVWPTELMPRRSLVIEATDELAETSRVRFGYDRAGTDWREAVEDPDIDVVDILLPNVMHREVAVAALEAGKHVICEKPLAVGVADGRAMVEAAAASDRVDQVGFNWRLVPAVQHARNLISEGAIGEVRSIRSFWLGDFFASADVPMLWRFDRAQAGSGALGDVGSHAIDFARALVGDISEVNAVQRTYVTERDHADGSGTSTVDVDDSTAFLAEFASGAHGYVEGSWASPGNKTHAGFEVQGSAGALKFDWERMNELQFYSDADPVDRKGFRTILMGPDQPQGEHFWPVAGYQIGYAESKALQIHDFLRAVAGEKPAPETTFADGLACMLVEEAVQRSAETRSWVKVEA